MVTIVAVDPGVMTGVVRAVAYGPEEISVLEWHEYTQTQFIDYFHKVLSTSLASLCVVTESFKPRKGYKTWQPASLELIGWMKGECHLNGNRIWLQDPGDAKAFGTDDRVKPYPVPRTKDGHARDALRHCLLWASNHVGESGHGR